MPRWPYFELVRAEASARRAAGCEEMPNSGVPRSSTRLVTVTSAVAGSPGPLDTNTPSGATA